MTAKIIEFRQPKTPYLAFVSLRERNLLVSYLQQKKIFCCVDDSGDIVAVHFKVSPNTVRELKQHFPNIHIVAGVL